MKPNYNGSMGEIPNFSHCKNWFWAKRFTALVAEKVTSQQTLVFKTSFIFVFRTHLQDVLIKTNTFALVICLQKTSSRRLQDVLVKTNIFVLAIHLQDVFKCLQDVFKTSCKNVYKTSYKNVFKTFSRRFEDVFKTSSTRLAKISSRRFQDVSSS